MVLVKCWCDKNFMNLLDVEMGVEMSVFGVINVYA